MNCGRKKKKFVTFSRGQKKNYANRESVYPKTTTSNQQKIK